MVVLLIVLIGVAVCLAIIVIAGAALVYALIHPQARKHTLRFLRHPFLTIEYCKEYIANSRLN